MAKGLVKVTLRNSIDPSFTSAWVGTPKQWEGYSRRCGIHLSDIVSVQEIKQSVVGVSEAVRAARNALFLAQDNNNGEEVQRLLESARDEIEKALSTLAK